MSSSLLDQAYQVGDDQLRAFDETSWVALPGLLDAEITEEIRQTLVDTAFRAPSAGRESVFLQSAPAAAEESFRKQEGLAWRFPLFDRLVTSPRLASAALGLMRKREGVVVQDSTYFKAAGGSPTGFHQDLPFLPYDRIGSITIWIALVDLTPDMGPLRYVEGTHRDGLLGRFIGQDLREEWPHLYDRAIGGGRAMRAGDAQAHWDLTVHGAAANTSDRAREAYAIRYLPAELVYTGSPHPHFDTIGLAPGQRFAESPLVKRISVVAE